MNVGQDTTRGNGDVAEELVQFLVVANGQLKMTGGDGLFLVISGSVSGQLEDFSSQILKDSGQVDGRARTNALSIVALSEEAVNTTNGELQTGLLRTRGGLVRGVFLSTFTSSHCVCSCF